MKVRDAMHRKAVWIAPDTSLSEIARTMREEDVGALPVGEDDRLIGMVTDRDVALRGFDESCDPLQMTARDVMSSPIYFCADDTELKDAVQIMEQRQIRRLPVINRDRRMVGILSMGDVAAVASPALCSEAMLAVSSHHA
jgi:CBS domain-containing protein